MKKNFYIYFLLFIYFFCFSNSKFYKNLFQLLRKEKEVFVLQVNYEQNQVKITNENKNIDNYEEGYGFDKFSGAFDNLSEDDINKYLINNNSINKLLKPNFTNKNLYNQNEAYKFFKKAFINFLFQKSFSAFQKSYEEKNKNSDDMVNHFLMMTIQQKFREAFNRNIEYLFGDNVEKILKHSLGYINNIINKQLLLGQYVDNKGIAKILYLIIINKINKNFIDKDNDNNNNNNDLNI